SVQFVLRNSGRTPRATGPWPAVTPRCGRDRRLPRPRGCGDGTAAYRTPPTHGRARRTGRAGTAPPTAATGIGVDGHPTHAVAEPDAARLRADHDAVTGGSNPTRLGAPSRWAARDRTRRVGVRFRQRGATPPSMAVPVRTGITSSDQQRVAGVHRRRRIPPPRTVVVRRMDNRTTTKLASTGILAPRRRHVAR